MERTGKSCYNPGDLHQILTQSRLRYKGQPYVEQKLEENCRENGLKFHGQTPSNGDCFFEAIASQLRRIGAHQFSSVQLRQEVTEYIRQHPTYEGPEGTVSLENFIEATLEDYCDEMAKRGTWADHVVVINMAKMLQRDIMIVTSSPSTSGNDCLVWVSGDRTGKNDPLLLGHMWENHYHSLQPIKLTVSPVIAEKEDTHSIYIIYQRNKDCDGHSEEWLRDKVGLFDILEHVPAFYTPWSLRLFSVMDDIGATEDVRKVRVESFVTQEILVTVYGQPKVSVYYFGSQADGTTTIGLESDVDIVRIFNNLPVATDPSEHPVGTSLLYIKDSTTPAGYCKLQLVQDGVPQTGDTPGDDWCPDESCRRWLTLTADTDNRLVCCFAPPVAIKGYDERHGPAMTIKASNILFPQDIVCAVECINTSHFIYMHNWFNRTRKFDWPSGDTLQTCEKLGCLFVPVGHPHSKFQKQQWRISFSHQEKLLVTQFNPVQFKCFILIKIIKKEIIHEEVPESLSSYHIKTCMFFIIENTPCRLWKPENLLVCISLCLRKLLEWIDARYCPNYFIPEENMFDRHIHGTVRQRLQAVLQKLVFADYKFLSDIQCDRLGERFIQSLLTPRVTSGDVDHSDCISSEIKLADCGMTFLIGYKYLLKICDSDIKPTLSQIIKSVSVLRNSTIITRHTIEETQKAKSLLLPYLELSLMSNSVAYAVDQHKHARDIWRLLTSIRWNEICLSSDSFSSRLKQASMLYMLGYYKTSLNVLSSLTSLVRYSICRCYADKGILVQLDIIATLLKRTRSVSELTPEHLLRNVIIPCVYFLPTEKSVTPAALCYEMKRMRGPRPGSHDDLCEYDEYYGDWAFVDGNFLLHFLLYLNHSRLNRTQQVNTDINNMQRLVVGNNTKRLSHRETCFNLLGWVYTEQAQSCFRTSLKVKPLCNAAFQYMSVFSVPHPNQNSNGQ